MSPRKLASTYASSARRTALPAVARTNDGQISADASQAGACASCSAKPVKHVAMSATLSETFTRGGNLDVAVNAAGLVTLTAGAQGSTSTSTTVELPRSVMLGYLLLNFS
jgi:hypothetical protein